MPHVCTYGKTLSSWTYGYMPHICIYGKTIYSRLPGRGLKADGWGLMAPIRWLSKSKTSPKCWTAPKLLCSWVTSGTELPLLKQYVSVLKIYSWVLMQVAQRNKKKVENRGKSPPSGFFGGGGRVGVFLFCSGGFLVGVVFFCANAVC